MNEIAPVNRRDVKVAADLYTTPPPAAEAPPPPVSEAPPTVGVAPPAVVVVPERRVVVVPERRVIVESGCPTVWRCGYWGCGWRASCAPVTADVYGVAPYWRNANERFHTAQKFGNLGREGLVPNVAVNLPQFIADTNPQGPGYSMLGIISSNSPFRK